MLDKIRGYVTGASTGGWRVNIFLAVLAVLGVGIGGFHGGDDAHPGVTIEVEEQDGTPVPPQTPSVEATPIPIGSIEGDGSDEGTSTNETVGEMNSTTIEATTVNNTDETTGADTSFSGMDVSVEKNKMNGQVNDVIPGDSGAVSLNVTNDSNRSGQLSATITNFRDYENGLTESEKKIDDDPGGELSRNLLVRWAVEGSDGNRTYLFDSSYQPITTLDEETGTAGYLNQSQTDIGVIGPKENVTVVFEWKIPAETGNKIQTDAVVFDIDFTLSGPMGIL